PDRILDIDPALEDMIILRDSQSSSGISGPYACLSHCWGGYQPLKTTKETLLIHMQGIHWERLPKTFQDAIAYARSLNINKIWIDSLCIIQDDMTDWAKQSALMAKIYRNAILTISATAAQGPNSGLFREQMEQDQPLLHRAWALQERLLSPRVLHFGATEIMWECMETSCCECGGEMYDFYLRDWEKKQLHPTTLVNSTASRTATGWRCLVYHYSMMRLTIPNDIFPAISGAAKVIAESLRQRGISSTYIAGMWKQSFIEECLWHTETDYLSLPLRRPLTYRAPTFSWASV
ncbi:HET-domain-containing protein, partial [Lojkania enalia]